MLCAKKLKAATVALTMILGAWAATPAYAVLDLTSTPDLAGHDVLVYAAESITTDSKSFTTLMATTEDRPLNAVAGTGGIDLSGDDVTPIYYRYDLIAPEGAAITWNGEPADEWNDHGTLTRQTDSFVVFTDSDGLDDDGTVTLALQDPNTGLARVKVRGATSGGGYKFMMRFRIYRDLFEAISLDGEGSVVVDRTKPIIAVENTLGASVAMPQTLTATVATGFTQLDVTPGADGSRGVLATINVTQTSTYDPDGDGDHAGWPIWNAGTGEPVSGSALKSASVEVEGDFSVGSFSVGGTGLALADADGMALEEDADPATAESGSAEVGIGSHAFAIAIAADNADMIPAGDYAATISLTATGDEGALLADGEAGTGTPPAIADASGPAGSITRDGTTVHIGYLTTFAGHNQRLVIVNRGPLEADYALAFVTEDGTEAIAGPMAEGTVPSGEQMVIQVRDVVSFAEGGSTRTAATLTLTADDGDIDVATTLVNTMDRSTDTVVYEAD